MTVEDFDTELTKIYDEFIIRQKAIKEWFEAECDKLGEKADEAGIKGHFVVSAVAQQNARLAREFVE